MPYVYDIDASTICGVFACADVVPRGREVEFQSALARQELERLPRGERHRNEDVAAQPFESERAARRRRFDDPGAGPSHAPLAAAGVDFEDIHCRLEVMLQDVPDWGHVVSHLG